jgi:hypothetical protein
MNPLRAWNRFWFAPISARPLGAFRVVFGVLMLCNLAFLAYDIDHWYTGAGLLQGNEAREVAGPLRYSVLNTIQHPLAVRIYFAATAVIALLLTLGWHTRVMSVLFYLTFLSIHQRNIVTCSGADALVMIMTFYIMLSPCGAAYSLDARRASRRRGTLAEPLIVPWAQRLIQLQIAVIYFNTAVLKCNGENWLNGTAIHYVLNNIEVGRFRLDPLSQYPLAINVLTYGAILIEFALAFFLWFRETRPWAILGGLALHGSILLTVNVPIFGELMSACYLTFLGPEELDLILKHVDLRRWWRRGRKAPASAGIPGRVDGPERLQGPHRYQGSPLVADQVPAEHD